LPPEVTASARISGADLGLGGGGLGRFGHGLRRRLRGLGGLAQHDHEHDEQDDDSDRDRDYRQLARGLVRILVGQHQVGLGLLRGRRFSCGHQRRIVGRPPLGIERISKAWCTIEIASRPADGALQLEAALSCASPMSISLASRETPRIS
jgi:hypothetical protein